MLATKEEYIVVTPKWVGQVLRFSTERTTTRLLTDHDNKASLQRWVERWGKRHGQTVSTGHLTTEHPWQWPGRRNFLLRLSWLAVPGDSPVTREMLDSESTAPWSVHTPLDKVV